MSNCVYKIIDQIDMTQYSPKKSGTILILDRDYDFTSDFSMAEIGDKSYEYNFCNFKTPWWIAIKENGNFIGENIIFK